VEQRNRALDFCDLVVPPPVVIPPLDLPAVCGGLLCDRFYFAVIPEIRDGEQVAFSLAGRGKRKEPGKFSHRTPDGKHAVRAKLHPVNGICSHGIEIIVREVDDMRSPAFYCIQKTAVLAAATCIRE